MRIIHTSDWHLGRNFGAVSLHDDQVAFCEWLVQTAITEAAELVIIAGDLYDRAIPPVRAIELFTSTVGALTKAGVKVAAITGNHDAADRVAPYLNMMDSADFYLRGGYRHIGEVVTLSFADGPLDLVLLPYLEPRSAPDDFGHEDEDLLADTFLVKRRLSRTHPEVMAYALQAATANLTSKRSVAVAHAFVTGGTISDSERQLMVGGTGEIPRSLFEGFSYTALGHLHRPQSVGGEERVRYAGSPLAYSFSEEHQKSITLVDLEADGQVETQLIEIPKGRRVATITGELNQLLTDATHSYAHECFVRAIVTNRETVLDAKAKLTERFPHVVEVQLRPGGQLPRFEHSRPVDRQLTPFELAIRFWEDVEGEVPDDAVLALLTEAAQTASERAAQ